MVGLQRDASLLFYFKLKIKIPVKNVTVVARLGFCVWNGLGMLVPILCSLTRGLSLNLLWKVSPIACKHAWMEHYWTCF